MSDKPMNDGGPAFPFTPNEQMKLPDGTWDQNTDFGDSGMSLRDWFAGMYLGSIPGEAYANKPETFARVAYSLADAMLTERTKGEPTP